MKKEKDEASKNAEFTEKMAYVLDDSTMLSREEWDKLRADPEFQRLEKELYEELERDGII